MKRLFIYKGLELEANINGYATYELKNDEFRHEHIGQLNAYVSYYAENEMQPGDNPPVGILLCTRKGEKMVEYALGNMDNKLFVSTYQLQLPDRRQLEQFLIDECHNQSPEE